jgi:hypothetical protein
MLTALVTDQLCEAVSALHADDAASTINAQQFVSQDDRHWWFRRRERPASPSV